MTRVISTIAILTAMLSFTHAAPPKIPIGMNIPSNNYYSTCLIFSDIMKTASQMITFDVSGTDGAWDTDLLDQIPRDTNGWPLSLPVTVNGNPQGVRILINNNARGEHVVLYDGDGDIDWHAIEAEKRNGKTYLQLTGEGGHVWMHITRSNAANPVRNMRIIPSEYETNESNMPLFNPKFVKGLEPFHCLRFMDWINTNNSTQKIWADRSTPTQYTQGIDKGMAFEYAIDLANLVNADVWICVPHQADDNYITKLATLVRDRLNTNLKCYIEYSNEVWNWGFSQSHYVGENAPEHNNKYVSDDLYAINPTDYQHPEKDAYMIARTFRLFTEVFSNQRSRLIRVAAVQHAWVDNTRRILEYLFNTDGIGCDVVSPAGYFNFEEADHNTWNAMNPNNVTAQMVCQAAMNRYDSSSGSWTEGTARYAKQFGVDYVVYEGGQHMQPYNQGEWAYNQAVWDAQIHPMMYDLYLKNFEKHAETDVNCKLFVAFSYVGGRESRWGSWGHLENLDQVGAPNLREIAPKYQALLDVNTPKVATSVKDHQVVKSVSSRLPSINISNITLTPYSLSMEIKGLEDRVATIHLYNASGRSVLTLNIDQNNNTNVTVHCNFKKEMNAGIYIMQLKQASRTIFAKQIQLAR